MIKHYLLSPGPTPIPNEVALAMSETMIHHRTPQFNKVFNEARDGLKKLFGTKNDVLMLASSGTGAMEASVANLFSPGDKVLVINGGKFGERWLNISNAYGLSPVEMTVEWGQAVKVADVEKQLKGNPDIQGVMIQASETSTTVFHPVKEIAKLTKNGPLLLVDGVTAVGVVPLMMDEWGIDVLVTGSQKALMLPPGLGFIALSDRAMEQVHGHKTAVPYYYDIEELAKYWIDRPIAYHHTMPILQYYALYTGIRLALNEGLENRWARHADAGRYFQQEIASRGFELLADPDHQLVELTAIKVPDGIDGKEVQGRFLREFDLEVGGGLGPTAPPIWRVGLMGVNANRETADKVLAAFDAVVPR